MAVPSERKWVFGAWKKTFSEPNWVNQTTVIDCRGIWSIKRLACAASSTKKRINKPQNNHKLSFPLYVHRVALPFPGKYLFVSFAEKSPMLLCLSYRRLKNTWRVRHIWSTSSRTIYVLFRKSPIHHRANVKEPENKINWNLGREVFKPEWNENNKILVQFRALGRILTAYGLEFQHSPPAQSFNVQFKAQCTRTSHIDTPKRTRRLPYYPISTVRLHFDTFGRGSFVVRNVVFKHAKGKRCTFKLIVVASDVTTFYASCLYFDFGPHLARVVFNNLTFPRDSIFTGSNV